MNDLIKIENEVNAQAVRIQIDYVLYENIGCNNGHNDLK